MVGLSEVRLVAGIGLEGDRYAMRLGTYSKNHHIDRQATLIEAEVLDALARDRAASSLHPTSHHSDRRAGSNSRLQEKDAERKGKRNL